MCKNARCLTFVNLTIVNCFTFVNVKINERYMKLVDAVSSSRSEFSKRTGISAVILSHINSGRNKVSLKAVIQLLETYPEINAEYLLLGKGNAFKTGNNKLVEKVREEINALNTLVNHQNSEIQRSIKSIKDHLASQ